MLLAGVQAPRAHRQLRARRPRVLSDELLSAVDVVGCAGECG
ncbi:MAG: hypothetical protein QOH34_1244, partial [Mycobacterium sp.]|nr:hypothetical protein [Mycobacterium sp.]